MSKQNKLVTIVSPMGEVEPYSYLHQPDYGFGEFKTDKGTYKVNITFDAKDEKVVKMMDTIESVFNQAVEEASENRPSGRGRKGPKTNDLPFVENSDGTVTFKFKSKASYTSRTTGEEIERKLSIVDPNGRPYAEVPRIGQGTKAKIKFSISPYGSHGGAAVGVSLRIEAVRVYELVEFTGGGDTDWGDEDDDFNDEPVVKSTKSADDFDDVDF